MTRQRKKAHERRSDLKKKKMELIKKNIRPHCAFEFVLNWLLFSGKFPAFFFSGTLKYLLLIVSMKTKIYIFTLVFEWYIRR